MTLGVCVAVTLKYGLSDAPELIDCLIGVVVISVAAFFARRSVRKIDEDSPYRKAIFLCRHLSSSNRFIGTMGILLAFLGVDHYLDSDPDHYHLFTFVGPIMVSTILFDLKPGLFAVALSSIAVDYLLISPGGDFAIHTRHEAAKLVIFAIAATAIAIALQFIMDWGWVRKKRPGNGADQPQLQGPWLVQSRGLKKLEQLRGRGPTRSRPMDPLGQIPEVSGDAYDIFGVEPSAKTPPIIYLEGPHKSRLE